MLEDFLHWLGYGLCHQLPERSFFGGGIQVPVCARDTGIYVGFVISLVIIALVHLRQRPAGFPAVRVWLLMAGFLAWMAWDGVSSYAGLRGTTNDLRLITGLGVGFSAAVVVFPMLQDELWRQSTRDRVLDPSWRLLLWLTGLPIAFVFIRYMAPSLGIVYPLFVALATIITLTSINLVMVAMLPAFDRKGETARDLLAPITIACLIGILEIVGAAYVRHLLEAIGR